MPKATDTIKQRRLKPAGHSYRHPEETVSNLVVWTQVTECEGKGGGLYAYAAIWHRPKKYILYW